MQFHLWPQCFQKSSAAIVVKCVYRWERVTRVCNKICNSCLKQVKSYWSIHPETSQSVIMLTQQVRVPRMETITTILKDFVMTQPGIEPATFDTQADAPSLHHQDGLFLPGTKRQGNYLEFYFPFNPFPHIDAFLHLCSRQLFENTVTKEEIAQNEQFLLLPQCFPLLVIDYPFN